MSLWVPVVAALGAALLSTLGTLGLEALRNQATSRSEAVKARRIAYVAFIEAANGMLMLGQTLRSLLRAQTGLAASFAALLRLRQPVDPSELTWRMADHNRPVLDGQAGILACGSPRAAIAASVVVSRASDYLQAATATTAAQRGLIGVVPWRPTREQDAELSARLDEAGRAVQAFLVVMREDLGEEALDLGSDNAPERLATPR